MNIIPYAAPSFDGRFVTQGTLSKTNKAILDKFLKHEFDGVSNSRFIRYKSYDVIVKQHEKLDDKLEFFASFKEPFATKNTDCFISAMYCEDSCIEHDTKALRGSLSWFESYKKKFNGYNNIFERIVSNFREIF